MTQARLDLETRSAERAALAQARAARPAQNSALGLFTATAYVKIGAGEYPIGEFTIDCDAPEGAGPIVRYGNEPACQGAGLDPDATRAEAAQRRAAGSAPQTTTAGPVDAPSCAERAAEALTAAARFAELASDPRSRADALATVAGGWRDLACALATLDALTRTPDDKEGGPRR